MSDPASVPDRVLHELSRKWRRQAHAYREPIETARWGIAATYEKAADDLDAILQHLMEPSGVGLAPEEGPIVKRVTWTNADVKLVQRAIELVAGAGWHFTFVCKMFSCDVVKRRVVPGGFEYYCEHQVVRCVRGVK